MIRCGHIDFRSLRQLEVSYGHRGESIDEVKEAANTVAFA
jgi:hypothetical protein